MLLSPVEHIVPKRYSGLELRMYEPIPVFSFPYKTHITSYPYKHRTVGMAVAEGDSLTPSEIRSAAHFLHFFKQPRKSLS